MLGEKYPIVVSFSKFMQEAKPVKVINKDQWSSMLDFCTTVAENLEDYDCTSSCKFFICVLEGIKSTEKVVL
jgi:DCN1-like protein 4/5